MGCELNKCCFCIPLRDGIFILGYIRLFYGLVTFVLCSALLSAGNSLLIGEDQKIMIDGRNIFIISLVGMAQGMFITSTSLLLVVGGHKRKSLPLRAYFWISIIGLVLEILYMLTATILSGAPIMLLVIFITSGIEIYFILVVRSTYMEIDMERANLGQGHNVENPLTTMGPSVTATSPPVYFANNH